MNQNHNKAKRRAKSLLNIVFNFLIMQQKHNNIQMEVVVLECLFNSIDI